MGKRSGYVMVAEDDPQWQRFWNAYPRRVGKKDARQAWTKLQPDVAMVDRMIETLGWQCQQPQWLKDDGIYVPHPATWLRAERFNDEQPMKIQRQMSDAAASVFDTLGVKL